MKNSVLIMRSINTLYFGQNNSLILKLTSGQRKTLFIVFFISLPTKREMYYLQYNYLFT
jgi:hypothetical protein